METLSDKMFFEEFNVIEVKDVKEFIKRLKQRIMTWIEEGMYDEACGMIDKLAGEELI